MPDQTSPASSRRTLRSALFIIAVAGAVAWAFYGRKLGERMSAWTGRATAAAKELDKLYAVKRGDFEIVLDRDGTLNAIKQHDLNCMGKGYFGMRIIEIVDDRTQVNKGDVVVRFADERYREEIDKLELELANANRDLALAREDLAMQLSTGQSAIKGSFDKLRDATDALLRYRDLDAPRERRAKQSAITDAEADLATSRSRLSDTSEARSGARSTDADTLEKLDGEVEYAQQEVQAAQLALDAAHHALRVFKQYDFPQRLRSLEEAVAQAQLNLRKAMIEAKGRQVQSERTIQNHELRIDSTSKRIFELRDDMEKMTIRAPVAGIVTHGNPQRRRWEVKEYKVGTEVNNREVIAVIPDLSKFKVDVQIPEEYRSSVREGLPAKLTSPAIPDLVMEGVIKVISPMASHQVHWDRSSPKLYDATIDTDMTDSRLMPGMTIKVEIIVETVRDALFIPVEAAYNDQGTTYCQVQTLTGFRQQAIVTGRSSNHFVEVIEGLQDGDKVLLQRPQGEPTG